MLWEDTVSKSYSNYLVVWGADIIFSLEIKSLLLGVAQSCSEHEYFYGKMSGKEIKKLTNPAAYVSIDKEAARVTIILQAHLLHKQ